jgi:CO/xanthine dehydrogenase FAD-binding subunit
MKAAPFCYHAARSVGEIVSLLETRDSSTVLLAGGQAVIPALNRRLCTPSLVVDIANVAELTIADRAQDHVVLGACVTSSAVEDASVPDGTRGILACVAARSGPRTVRCHATIGGSLCLGDSVSDWIVGLSALDAVAEATSACGTRSIAVSDIGRSRTSAVASDELLVSIRIPDIAAGSWWGTWDLRRSAGARPDIAAAVLADARDASFRCAVAVAGRALIVLAYRDPPEDLRKVMGSGAPPSTEAMLDIVNDELAAAGEERATARLIAAALGRAAASAIRV